MYPPSTKPEPSSTVDFSTADSAYTANPTSNDDEAFAVPEIEVDVPAPAENEVDVGIRTVEGEGSEESSEESGDESEESEEESASREEVADDVDFFRCQENYGKV